MQDSFSCNHRTLFFFLVRKEEYFYCISRIINAEYSSLKQQIIKENVLKQYIESQDKSLEAKNGKVKDKNIKFTRVIFFCINCTRCISDNLEKYFYAIKYSFLT